MNGTKHAGMIAALLLALVLIISGCAPAEPEVEEQPTAAVEEPAEEPTAEPEPEPEPTEEPAEEEPAEEEPAEEEPAEETSDEGPVLFFAPAELSGAGATVGTNWKNGVELAVEDINAGGGILGRQVEVLFEDTQSDPATSKAVIAKGLEENPYAIVGPLYSGSIIVNMVEAERAQIPQIVGGEAANLTQQGNPYIFRTSFGQATSMPKLASHMEDGGIGSVDIIWINNDFGKGGRDAITAEFEARGIEIMNDISAEEQQADFAPEALTVLGSGAEALFVYMNEEESARLLVELGKQGFEKPIFGETVLISQAVIDLAGEAANGSQGHVGLTASAPIPAIEEYAQRFEEKFEYVPDHNGLKGYIAMHVLKEMTERMGEFNSQKLAEDLHCTTITTEDEPGVLMDIVYDENGDVDRESFLVEVQDGQQVVTEVLPRLGGTCGEDASAAAEDADAEDATAEASGEPVLLFAPAELSGAGATVGTNWKNGVELAIKNINAAGGILGRPVEALFEDTQSDPATSKAVIAKGLEENPYAIVGPLYSGSIIVNMVEAERAQIPQIVGGEAANLTQQGNPYIFRTSFGQATSMPKLASHMEDSNIGSVDIIWINNDFGKGGRDAITAEFEARGIEIMNDISAEEQQADFAPEALTVLGSGAEALFVYMNEEESARLLVELKKQGFEKPIFGETVLISQAVIDLAGDAANGSQGHVGLTASAPIPAIEEYAAQFEEEFGFVPDHNGLKGYIAVHVVKEMTERMGEFDSQKLAEQLHCTTITTEDEPGVLMDIVYDENGDVDRESFLVEVQGEAQVVTEILPRLGGTCGEDASAAAEDTEDADGEAAAEASGEPVLLFAPAELSGAGATVGTNWKNGVELAIEDINGAGGILGRPVEALFEDTQSDPATSKAVIAKGLEENPYAIVGPLYSGSIIVNMVEAERAEIPQIVGGEAANLTQQGNPYIFRTSFGQATSMPKLASHMEDSNIGSVDIIWINNDFGKGGRDAITAEFEARGIEIMNDISAEEQQADFAPEALTVLGSGAEALFVYMNEEESARLLVELKKQGFEKPIFGETVLISQAVIDLAGDAANGSQGHVGLTASAPIPAIEEYAARFEEKFGFVPDHNGLKGYIAVHVVKEMTERMGEFDSQKLAEQLHCTTITTEDEPGVLMDIVYDENGDVDRESFLVEVQGEEQVVTEVLPRLGGTCGEEGAAAEEENAEAAEASGEPVLLFAPAELSGAGATVGTNWKNGVELAIEDINGAGGILGRPVEALFEDTQSDPATSKAVIAKGLEENPYAIVGPLYSGSIIVNMVEAERAEIPQIVGGEAANLTQQGNPYIFRTSFGQATSMPKLASHMEDSNIGSVDIIWINNDFGKGGRDAITAEFEARGIEIMNDISAEEQQADFAPEALTVLGSGAEALFVYMNEEESARLLVELKKQGFEKPIFGETVLISQAVIDLAGDAANGSQGHVGLTASAPIPAIEEYAARFEEKFGFVPDHNGLKGYIAVHVVKEMTERMGEFDSQKLAEQLHCTTITTEDEPGVLMDIVYDENGDVDRESFLVEVQGEAQVVTSVLPRLGGTCGEQ